MIENEKKILRILAKRGEMTKKELASALKVSWATVVKITKRLEQAGLIEFNGRPERKNIQGVDSAVFILSNVNPTSIGIDVGYSDTIIIVSNLNNEILLQRIIPNPELNEASDIITFLGQCIAETISGKTSDWKIHGVGIGVPAFILPEMRDVYTDIQEILNRRFDLPVRIDRNVRGYTLYKRFEHNVDGNFIIITIRTGIGLGIILNNRLFCGETNMAGELSHMHIPELEELCRCGQRGCLETGLNYTILAEDYRQVAHKIGLAVNDPAPVARLMELASEEVPEALAILKVRSHILSQALIPLLLILNIYNITVSGNFGEHGKVFTDLVNQEISKNSLLIKNYSIRYEKFKMFDFAIGASHLILEDFI